MKNYLKSYTYLLIIIITLTLILSLINYFFSNEWLLFKIIIPIIAIFISSFVLGKDSKKKAYLEGIKFSLIYLFLATFSSIIMHNSFNIKTLIYYMVIIFTAIIGSMMGINLKKNK